MEREKENAKENVGKSYYQQLNITSKSIRIKESAGCPTQIRTYEYSVYKSEKATFWKSEAKFDNFMQRIMVPFKKKKIIIKTK